MNYAFIFGVLGLGLVILAKAYPSVEWPLYWGCVSFLWVGLAYLFNQPLMLGKRPDGTTLGLICLLFLPYFALVWIVWFFQINLTREPAVNQIAPGLWIGRRIHSDQLPANVSQIVDLVAELPEDRTIRKSQMYLSIPVLDGTAPPVDVLMNLAKNSHAIFIHCALGYGRSATVVAATLILRGIATGPDHAESIIKIARPGVRLNRNQKRALASIASKSMIKPLP